MNLARIENELGNPNNFESKRAREDYERECFQVWIRAGAPPVDAFPLTLKAFRRAREALRRYEVSITLLSRPSERPWKP